MGPEGAEGFEWDDDLDPSGNTAHLARHQIVYWEAEQVWYNQGILVPNRKRASADWMLVGRTDAGRALTLIMNYLDYRRLIRFITGWDCSAGERKKYLEPKGRRR